jgi:hypothetical protein
LKVLDGLLETGDEVVSDDADIVNHLVKYLVNLRFQTSFIEMEEFSFDFLHCRLDRNHGAFLMVRLAKTLFRKTYKNRRLFAFLLAAYLSRLVSACTSRLDLHFLILLDEEL